MENNQENQNIPENNNAENEIPETGAPETPAADVSFSHDEPIQTVKKKPTDPRKNNLPVILLICVLVIAIAAGVIIYLVKHKQPGENPANGEISTGDNIVDPESHAQIDDTYVIPEGLTDEQGNAISKEEILSMQQQIQEATTLFSADVGVTSPHVIEEPTTQTGSSSSSGSTTAQNTELVNKIEPQIKAFLNQSCYMQGAFYSADGEGGPITMAMDGDNFETMTSFENIELSVLKLDGKMYFKRPALKQYAELNDSMMDLIGISPDDFNFSFGGGARYDDIKKNLVGTYDVKIDGKDGVCFLYKTGESHIYKFYAVDDSLTQIDFCKSDGTVDSQLVLSYFSETIPGDQLTLKGFTEASFINMFADVFLTEKG